MTDYLAALLNATTPKAVQTAIDKIGDVVYFFEDEGDAISLKTAADLVYDNELDGKGAGKVGADLLHIVLSVAEARMTQTPEKN